MSRFVKASHTLASGMPGLTVGGPEGCRFEATAKIATVSDHRESAPLYAGKVAFAFTGAEFHVSDGAYVDSPRGRFLTGCEAEAAA